MARRSACRGEIGLYAGGGVSAFGGKGSASGGGRRVYICGEGVCIKGEGGSAYRMGWAPLAELGK